MNRATCKLFTENRIWALKKKSERWRETCLANWNQLGATEWDNHANDLIKTAIHLGLHDSPAHNNRHLS